MTDGSAAARSTAPFRVGSAVVSARVVFTVASRSVTAGLRDERHGREGRQRTPARALVLAYRIASAASSGKDDFGSHLPSRNDIWRSLAVHFGAHGRLGARRHKDR